MDYEKFKSTYEDLKKNIDEIKSTTKKADLLESPDRTKILDRMKYLFYSLIKSLVDIGHGIILENDYREPLNRADIFISLAEREIIVSSLVPGVKKAVLALPKMNEYTHSQILEIISKSINELDTCLSSYGVYFNLKDKNI
ncbi:hypothetical protein KAX97_09730 [candidate division WOR-3 bacterium]|nr:hypothetical protein [candidate division WOR-3 bacterium]